jgi:mannose-6-phosphate isomerase-like protein (cupin superfamily)
MLKGIIQNLDDKNWRKIREDVTNKVYGKDLHSKTLSDIPILLIKVEPGGTFPEHVDTWSHVFYFLKGEGIATLGDNSFVVKENIVVEVPAGIKHSYKNTGTNDLFLITLKIESS